jgi:hypothetical protein
VCVCACVCVCVCICECVCQKRDTRQNGSSRIRWRQCVNALIEDTIIGSILRATTIDMSVGDLTAKYIRTADTIL